MTTLRPRAYWFGLIVLALTVTAVRAAPATTAPSTGPTTSTQPTGMGGFMRFVGDAKSGGVLQTGDVTYRKGDATVRLVAAVHIGEEAYFNALAKSFEKAGVVLYEMVKPAGVDAPERGTPPQSGIGQLQHFLKDTLNLSFQLDVVDYTQPNFVHADLDAETFQRLQAERGESFFTLMLTSMIRAMSNPGRAGAAAGVGTDPEEPQDMLDLMSRPDGERQIKLLLARQFGQLEADAMGLDTLTGSVILTERNKAVIKVLRKQLADGKKNIVIFYGAAHMPDLAEKLDLMGFEPVETNWHDAWDVRIRKDAPSAFQKLQERLQQKALEQ